MHGREGENWKRSQHMQSVPSTTRTVAGDSVLSSVDSFCKYGRKVRVGDCALFKSPQDSPRFIGIIRWLTVSKDKKIQLGVNWLYRPAEVNLGKGILLEAAPNEIFYSFHEDEIPVASLLHPCKVAFLPKGVELPPGISSFVCRRVYDIANKCLWWLTDQDYIDERQEEVDQLLNKTRIEMHATVQPGGRSPKPINGPTSTSQLKASSDGIPNSTPSFPSQAKGKKRDRGDQGSEPLKRERSLKIDDSDPGPYRADSILRSEIAKITEKGGLTDSEGVEKLVQLMSPDRVERKMDLISRSILAGVISATEKFDCLNRFVQLRGLAVFDDWLQDIHKGKTGDGSSPKDGDKSVEELLLVLLRALDKLPVNLNALQMCNIGRSVNHLRTHKNLEIQKKARSLVDTWKKRVEVEMNIIEAKSGSSQAVPWTSKSRLPDVSHGGSKQPSGSDAVMKCSVSQFPACKSTSVKPLHAETAAKSASSSPGPIKSALSPASGKDYQPRVSFGSTSDLLVTTAKEEKSSSSSHSHNYGQAFSGKEDARSSTTGSMSVNKISTSASRHRKSNNGFPGSSVSGIQRETNSCRSSSVHKNLTSEILSQSGLTSEKAVDVPIMEGNSHKLIVKIPNRGRSPAQCASGASFEDPSNMNSRASSPVLLEKHDLFERNLKEKGDSFRANIASDVNTESWQSNDFKDVLTGSDEGDGSPATIPDEERSRSGEETRRTVEGLKAASSSSGNDLKSGKSHEGSFSTMHVLLESCAKYSEPDASISAMGADRSRNAEEIEIIAEASKAASSSSGNDPKSGKSHAASFSSINALAESCVKYSEANASVSVEDDVGMNLLASVAAGEMSNSDLVSPTDSPQGNTSIVEHSCIGDAAQLKSLPGDTIILKEQEVSDNAVVDPDAETQGGMGGGSRSINGPNHDSTDPLANFVTGQKAHSPLFECASKRDCELVNSSGMDSQPTSDSEANEKLGETKGTSLAASPGGREEKVVDHEVSKQVLEQMTVLTASSVDSVHGTKTKGSCSFMPEDKINDTLSSIQDEKQTVEISQLHSSMEFEGGDKDDLNEGSNGVGQAVQMPSAGITRENVEKTDKERLHFSGSGENCFQGNHDEDNIGKTDEMGTRRTDERRGSAQEINPPAKGNKVLPSSGSAVSSTELYIESKEVGDLHSAALVPLHKMRSIPVHEKQHERFRASKLTGGEKDEVDKCASTSASAKSLSTAEVPDMDSKLKFDLNEGLAVDDGRCGEPHSLTSHGCSSSVQLVNPLNFTVSSVSSSLPISITVAAAAKGPFVPPEDLLRSKGELGWKGSAATSAFRPAEPRKILEMPLGTPNQSVPDTTASKPGRPLLDFDLNVADERVLEDVPSCDNAPVYNNDLVGSASVCGFGRLDLDLNRVDEANDMGQCSGSNRRPNALLLPDKTPSSGGFSNGEIRRDFDLNNGPVLDDASVEPSLFVQRGRGSIHPQPPATGLKMNNADITNYSSWFPHGNTYSNVAIPSILSDRVEQPFPIIAAGGGPQRILGISGGPPFTSDVYRGSVLPSSPAVAFSSTPFQYPVFPFGTSFPLPSTSFSGGSTAFVDPASGGRFGFPTIPSQLLGPTGAVSSPFPRPYVVTLPDCSNSSSAENNRKWGVQGLDLNAGPGGLDIEAKDENSMPLASRQLSVTSSQALAEEQARIYHVAVGGALKRKEPDGGWEPESFRYKQSSWQ